MLEMVSALEAASGKKVSGRRNSLNIIFQY